MAASTTTSSTRTARTTFYKGNTKDENGKEYINGIQQATSKSLKGPWKEDFKYLDAYAGTKTHVEGSGVFKLNDKDEYVLMYDLYSSGRYDYQTSKDLVNRCTTMPMAALETSLRQ